ncbi:MAG: hypothetical protein AAGN66_11245 [Acidobacteriota bacterium]
MASRTTPSTMPSGVRIHRRTRQSIASLCTMIVVLVLCTASQGWAVEPLWAQFEAGVTVRAGNNTTEVFKTSFTEYGAAAFLSQDLVEEGHQAYGVHTSNGQAAYSATYLEASQALVTSQVIDGVTSTVTQGAVDLGCDQEFVGTSGAIRCVTLWRLNFRPEHDGYVLINFEGSAAQACDGICYPWSTAVYVKINGETLRYTHSGLNGSPQMQVPIVAGQDTLLKVELYAGASGSILSQERTGDFRVVWEIVEQ